MPLLHTMLSTTAHKQAKSWEGCHRNVYKSRPEECKQSWVELLSDKRVNFRQSCCDLPVWSFNYKTARILSEWMIVWAFLSFYSPSNSNKTCIHVYRSSSGGGSYRRKHMWREWSVPLIHSSSQQGFKHAGFVSQSRLTLWQITAAHRGAGWGGGLGHAAAMSCLEESSGWFKYVIRQSETSV